MVTLDLSPEKLLRLKNLAGIQNGGVFTFLGFSLNIDTSKFEDDLQKGSATIEVSNPTMYHQITELLDEYSRASKKPLGGRAVKFREFPGGIAYENAFGRKAVDPVAKSFGNSPDGLIEAAMLLGGKKLDFGQASVEIPAFNLVPITYILWVDEDLPPSVNILFDETGSNYLNAEGLANLAELTTWRLTLAKKLLQSI